MDEYREDYFRTLAKEIRNIVKEEKLYKDNHLSLDDIANQLNTSRYYVSYAVNKYLGKSFSTFVNELRIEEARRIMENGTQDRGVEGVARDSGFSDRTNFFRVCRRLTGLRPSDLRPDNKNN